MVSWDWARRKNKTLNSLWMTKFSYRIYKRLSEKMTTKSPSCRLKNTRVRTKGIFFRLERCNSRCKLCPECVRGVYFYDKNICLQYFHMNISPCTVHTTRPVAMDSCNLFVEVTLSRDAVKNTLYECLDWVGSYATVGWIKLWRSWLAHRQPCHKFHLRLPHKGHLRPLHKGTRDFKIAV